MQWQLYEGIANIRFLSDLKPIAKIRRSAGAVARFVSFAADLLWGHFSHAMQQLWR
jgi:hypothetical protein